MFMQIVSIYVVLVVVINNSSTFNTTITLKLKVTFCSSVNHEWKFLLR